ncbi:MAG: cyclic nucleotide-binding domain-containing protein, partial [Gammaproteobacteria bacterium]
MTEHTTMPNRNTLVEIIQEHPFFAGLAPEYCELVGGCAKNVRFNEGDYLLREGEAANEFYLLRHGRVAIDIHLPGKPDLTIQTLGPGEIVGV